MIPLDNITVLFGEFSQITAEEMSAMHERNLFPPRPFVEVFVCKDAEVVFSVSAV